MLCVVAGADLFTSNCMYSAIGVWEGAATTLRCAALHGGAALGCAQAARAFLGLPQPLSFVFIWECLRAGTSRSWECSACSAAAVPLRYWLGTAGRFGLYGWARMLVVSYFANLVGALLLVGLMMGGDVSAVRAGCAAHAVLCCYWWGS